MILSKASVLFFIGIILLCGSSCKRNNKLFQPVSSGHSGIDFNNRIIEKDTINPIDLINIYNGGGVGVGDFNNDGLQDIYFTGNRVSNKLYLNKGNMQFEDVTASAGVGGNGKWCRGVAVVDINNDGWMDLYVCASMYGNPQMRKNLLYINEGKHPNGSVTFKESAAAYGLDDTSHSTMASFFDYDNDGDLDVYIVVNQILPRVDPSTFKPRITDGSFPSTGRLYRNDPDSTLKHPVFTDVTQQAGLTIEGYGHGVNVADINKDGWKDIFVTNDFISNDLLYINNRDGTFTDKAATYFKHTSANGMGQDVIDINNDGLSDVVELDMNPEDNYRKKMMLGSSSYQTSQLNDFFKYQYQYVRNTIQLNQGPRVNANDSIGDPIFSETGFIAGVSATDWSWSPLVADFDGDGWRDLVVTNGFPKDVTDHDFMTFRQEASPVTSQARILSQIPEVKLHNYAFQNTGNGIFTDVSETWGLTDISFSNGAAYADLDNDGDLDMIINNINDKASLYENTVMDSRPDDRHYISVQLIGDSLNLNGLGTWVEIYYNGQHQAYEQTPYRGYLSTMQVNPHFGIGAAPFIDSLVVKWPDGDKEVITKLHADQTVKVRKEDSKSRYQWAMPLLAGNALFREITAALGIHYVHTQTDYPDFSIQKLLPHKFSEYGPSMAAGDLNSDGLDDIVIGGNATLGTTVLIQQANGRFGQKVIIPPAESPNVHFQDMGILLFDPDGDGDLDIYVARGGYNSGPNRPDYQGRFLVNDGKGNFVVDTLAIPENFTSKSCVRAIDYDKDGDLDLFVGGRVVPWNYPAPASSFIYRNDSGNGQVRFTDVNRQATSGFKDLGLICDAIVTDFDNDTWPDLVLAGEWMPVTFLKNERGVFRDVTVHTGLSGQSGWWNTITSGDFDNDGDTDYVVGNLGRNSFYQASEKYPVSIYAKDFDNNGSYDAFTSLYLSTSQEDIGKKEFPAHMRDDAVKQMIGMRSRFQNYKSYASASMSQLFSDEELKDALILKATHLSTSYCRNDGSGKFTLIPLPFMAQWSAFNGMISDDFDGDGNLDLIANTNDYGADVTVGRSDALNGLMLKGDGKGDFRPQSILESGIFIPGNGKALVKLRGKDGQYLVAAAQNRGPLKVFELKEKTREVRLEPDEVSAELTFRSGRIRKVEAYSGASFLSQSSRFLNIDKNVKSAAISTRSGKVRKVSF